MSDFTNEHVDAEFVDETLTQDSATPPETEETPTSTEASSLRKAAEDTAYAAVGVVGLVADKAREFYEEQRKQYVAAHPEAEDKEGAQGFLAQLRFQLDKLVDDVSRGFRDMAERGRASTKDGDGKIASLLDRATVKADEAADDVSQAAHSAADSIGDVPDDAAEHVADAADDAARRAEDPQI